MRSVITYGVMKSEIALILKITNADMATMDMHAPETVP